ncbi:MAG: hypothetical protein FWE31_00075 [Firmicutes bacterium]|nr:hypothetical protein [Bacillota bacterium]
MTKGYREILEKQANKKIIPVIGFFRNDSITDARRKLREQEEHEAIERHKTEEDRRHKEDYDFEKYWSGQISLKEYYARGKEQDY